MSNASVATFEGFQWQGRPSTLAFLAKPYALFFAIFLATMVALSVDLPLVHNAAMKIRWPIMAVAALFGTVQAAAHGFRRFHPAAAFLGIVVLVTGISATWSIDPNYSIQRFLSLTLLYAATFLGVTAYCRNSDNAAALFDLLWWIGAILILGGFVFRMGEVGPGGRYVGLHDRATGAGTYAALFLPIAIFQVRFRFMGFWKFVGWCVVAAIFLQLVLSGARMAMASAGVVAVTLWLAYYGRKAIVAIVLLACIAPVPVLLDQRSADRLQERSEKLLRPKTFSNFTGRLDRWLFGLEKFAEKPLTGYGFGVSRTLAGLDQPWRFGLQPGEVFNLHSDQIEVLMDLGIIGYTPFALFWLAVGVSGLMLVRHPSTDAKFRAIAVLGAVFYAFGDTFMHGGFLAAGGGVAPFSWSMIAMFLALLVVPQDIPASGAHRQFPAQAGHPDIPWAKSPDVARTISRSHLPSVQQILRRDSREVAVNGDRTST